MPEGPEVRREADRIAAALEHHRVLEVFFGLERLRNFADHLCGHVVTRVTTRGKALLTEFDNGYSLYSHNQLYGRWYVCRRGQLPSTNRSLRVALHTQDHSALLYSASDIDVLRTAELPDHPFIARLGPDVLDDSLHWRDIAARLAEGEFSGRSLAALYLDQHFLAGIGNYLRSEILFAARLNPSLKSRELSLGQRGRLARATLEVSRRSYETGGLTNTPARLKALKRAGLAGGAYRFAVFARENQPCHVCGTQVMRAKANSRRIFWCPSCQAGPSSAEL